MRRLHRAGPALLVAASVVACAPAERASEERSSDPSGITFPTWHVGADGAAALLDGRIVMNGRCVYVAPPQGRPFLVVWPDDLQLAVVDGTPSILHGSRVVATVGGEVRLGGGELTHDQWPASVEGCDTSQVWGANAINP